MVLTKKSNLSSNFDHDKSSKDGLGRGKISVDFTARALVAGGETSGRRCPRAREAWRSRNGVYFLHEMKQNSCCKRLKVLICVLA